MIGILQTICDWDYHLFLMTELLYSSADMLLVKFRTLSCTHTCGLRSRFFLRALFVVEPEHPAKNVGVRYDGELGASRLHLAIVS